LLHVELSRRAGADFVELLLERVRQSRVMLAVIGVRWLEVAGQGGGRRIDDPADLVRRELAQAFAAGCGWFRC